MADEIDGYMKRPIGYMYVDGIYEMFMGVVFWGYSFLDPVWLILLTVIAYGGTHILKKRITYPRTGYVRLRSYRKKAWIAGIAGFVVAFGVWFAFRGAAYSILVLGTAVIWAFLYSYITILAHLENAWWRWMVTLAMIVGPVFASLHSEDRLGMGVVGFLFLISGAITFALYMRRTHPPQEVAE